MTQRSALKKLAEAIEGVVGDGLNPISLRDEEGRSVMAWEGPYEWTMITAGSSIFAGELGNYSLPTEPAIAKVIAEVGDAGLFFEPKNHFTLCCFAGRI